MIKQIYKSDLSTLIELIANKLEVKLLTVSQSGRIDEYSKSEKNQLLFLKEFDGLFKSLTGNSIHEIVEIINQNSINTRIKKIESLKEQEIEYRDKLIESLQSDKNEQAKYKKLLKELDKKIQLFEEDLNYCQEIISKQNVEINSQDIKIRELDRRNRELVEEIKILKKVESLPVRQAEKQNSPPVLIKQIVKQDEKLLAKIKQQQIAIENLKNTVLIENDDKGKRHFKFNCKYIMFLMVFIVPIVLVKELAYNELIHEIDYKFYKLDDIDITQII